MTLPAGIEAGYGLCLLWFLLEVALYAVLHQMGSLDALRENVNSGTERRLAPLNEFLMHRFDDWTGPAQGGQEEAPLIRDRVTLHDLKRAVEKASKLETLLQNRIRFEEIGRLSVVVSMTLPFLTAVLLFADIDRSVIGVLALTAFIVLTLATLVAILFVHVLRIRVVSGTSS